MVGTEKDKEPIALPSPSQIRAFLAAVAELLRVLLSLIDVILNDLDLID